MGENCFVGHFAYIGENTIIGKDCYIYPNTFIGDNVTVGENCILYPHAGCPHPGGLSGGQLQGGPSPRRSSPEKIRFRAQAPFQQTQPGQLGGLDAHRPGFPGQGQRRLRPGPMLLLFKLGQRDAEIAENLDCNRSTISRWRRVLNDHGAGL